MAIYRKGVSDNRVRDMDVGEPMPDPFIDDPYGDSLYLPPMMNEKDQIGILKELKPDDVLKRVKMKLMGYDYNDIKKEWIKEREPLMNDEGINKYMTVLSSVSELVTLSRFKEEQVPSHVQFVCDQIIPTIDLNWRKYGISCKSDLNIISVQLFMFTHSALNKAIGGGDRNVVRGTVGEDISRKHITLPQGYERREGMMSKLNPFK